MEDHLAKQRLARTRQLVADSGLSLFDARRQATKELRVPKETSLLLRMADSLLMRMADSTTANAIRSLALAFFYVVLGGVLLRGCLWVFDEAPTWVPSNIGM
jgi:hypothetical protein